MPVCTAQTGSLYGIDVNKGLPSNHIYYVLQDSKGYLWMATDKGVVKYNGYELKIFDRLSGMSQEDKWYLHEDRKGRMWLSGISDEIGYIKDDVYQPVHFNNNSFVYPTKYLDYDSGIIFLSGDRIKYDYLCFERNDTVTTYRLSTLGGNSFYLSDDGRLIQWSVTGMYELVLKAGKVVKRRINTRQFRYGQIFSGFFVPQFIYPGDGGISIFSVDNGKSYLIKTKPGESLLTSNLQNGKFLYSTTNHNIYTLDIETGQYRSTNLTDSSGNPLYNGTVITMTENPMWGRVIATTEGVRMDLPGKSGIPVKYKAGRYKYLGISGAGTEYVLNELNNTIELIKPSGIAPVILPRAYDLRKVVPFKDSGSIITIGNFLYRCGNDDLPRDTALIEVTKEQKLIGYLGGKDFIADSSGEIYLTTLGRSSFVKYHNRQISFIDSGIYRKLLYDSLRNAYCAFGNSDVLIYKDDNSIKITKKYLAEVGVTGIDDIIVAKHGEVIVKTKNNLFLAKQGFARFEKLLVNYNLNKALTIYETGVLCVAGRFGAAFLRNDSPFVFKISGTWANTKQMMYDDIYSLSVLKNKAEVWLSTNMGTYTMDLNDATAIFHEKQPEGYKIYARDRSSFKDLTLGDTLELEQDKPVIFPEIIKPLGVGVPVYKFSVPDITLKDEGANNRELLLRGLKPGRYYKVLLKAEDEMWRSRVLAFSVYIVPYWWQTSWGSIFVIIAAVISVTIIAVVSAKVTGNMVRKRNLEKQERLELELKSVYAQINPHFIFNTLNSGLYFVKKKRTDEAYEHFASFSRLLRGYLNASRNKYITLADELVILRNYITLQLTRFEDRFDYEIAIANDIHPDLVHIPSLLLQPLVENAIIHGLVPAGYKGYLSISFVLDMSKNMLICTIDDNGIGRKSSMESKANTMPKPSYGTEITKDLIRILNTYDKKNISLEYIDKQFPQTGTMVTIRFRL